VRVIAAHRNLRQMMRMARSGWTCSTVCMCSKSRCRTARTPRRYSGAGPPFRGQIRAPHEQDGYIVPVVDHRSPKIFVA
jgi:hypothetical protein